MDRIIIKGGKKLKGEVTISGAKNAALPILLSSLLVDGECVFTNVPKLQDIETTKQLLKELGAKVKTDNGTTVSIDCSNVSKFEAPYNLVRKMRASILALCPLVARFNKAKISLPGGCAIGTRPVDLHLKGLEALGAEINLKHGYIEAKVKELKGAEIYFDVPTVTGTENLMMAASVAKGVTTLNNAAREPEIIALADVLKKMGVKINGAGTSVIKIDGVSKLKPVKAKIIPDRIEAGTFMIASAVTCGDIKILNCNPKYMTGIIEKLILTGTKVDIGKTTIRVRGVKNIKSIDIKTLPYPGFPTDMQAQFMVLLSIAKGQGTVSETIFEKRFMHVSELQRMGADISVLGETVASVRGVKKLSGAEVMASDLRASASLVIAGLCAEGITEVNRIYHLDRGYEKIEEKLIKLGANIKREKIIN